VSDVSIDRDTVILVLKAGGVSVSLAGDCCTLAKDATIETIVLPQRVERRMLFRFQYKYGVPIHWFFNPEMIPGAGSGTIH
jgi:hypothetical protein